MPHPTDRDEDELYETAVYEIGVAPRALLFDACDPELHRDVIDDLHDHCLRVAYATWYDSTGMRGDWLRQVVEDEVREQVNRTLRAHTHSLVGA